MDRIIIRIENENKRDKLFKELKKRDIKWNGGKSLSEFNGTSEVVFNG